jgi:hypothetical protein
MAGVILVVLIGMVILGTLAAAQLWVGRRVLAVLEKEAHEVLKDIR